MSTRCKPDHAIQSGKVEVHWNDQLSLDSAPRIWQEAVWVGVVRGPQDVVLAHQRDCVGDACPLLAGCHAVTAKIIAGLHGGVRILQTVLVHTWPSAIATAVATR